jgi:hypothetical protein
MWKYNKLPVLQSATILSSRDIAETITRKTRERGVEFT